MSKKQWIFNKNISELFGKKQFLSWHKLIKIFVFISIVMSINPPIETSAAAISAPLTDASGLVNGNIRKNLLAPGPAIHDINTNSSIYPNGQIPRYEKFEITFQVDTLAANLQLPFDAGSPSGVVPGVGISVDALFTPDNWTTIYKQPAFYYQQYDDQVKSGREWIYPIGLYSWKVRFSPDKTGNWQYKLTARDSNGYSETSPASFVVTSSSSKGNIRVSQTDTRYFEYEDGTYFPGLAYNMNFNHISWNNPVIDNEQNFQTMAKNGIQMARLWLSEWGIYGSSWNPWDSINSSLHSQYIPYSGTTFADAYPGSEVSMEIESQYNPCMFLGFMKSTPAVKRNTEYRVRIRYKTSGIVGPRISGQSFGLVAKTGGWLWGSGSNCNDPGTGTSVTPDQPQNSTGWQILEGSLNSGSSDFMPNFYLAMENVTAGKAYIDYVWIEENLGNSQYGPNIVTKPWMAQHLYMEQRDSYAFDKVLELAEQNGIYLRPVIMEKNEYIFNRIDYQGNVVSDDPKCWDTDPNNDPVKCPGNQWFYGNWREMTKTRWLQQAWWRYIQARWGYSTNIHSWELLNEGDPYNGLHYTLADEFGKYMHQFKPDDHMVSTSFWHSFPKNEFWANPAYQNVDFADYHQYIGEDTPEFKDTTQATLGVSLQFGAEEPGGAGKPVIRGETGFINPSTWEPTTQFQSDPSGIWLHNFIWGGINAGGLIESYWFENFHIYEQNVNKSFVFDLRPEYLTYYNFIKQIPLNNGHYQDIAAQSSNNSLRILGQKDVTNGQAHIWIQNNQHIWKNVVDGVSIPAIASTITIPGFKSGKNYMIQWCDPYQPNINLQIIRNEVVIGQNDGSLKISITNLSTDVALKISPMIPRGANDRFIPFLSR